MRLWTLSLAALVGCALGCNKSPEGGTSPDKPAGSGSGFKISLPPSAETTTIKTVKQGTSETFSGSIDRGSDFKKDVHLKVEAPAHVEVKLNKDTVKASDADTKFSITVTPDKEAPVGEHTIKVSGTPDGGGSSTSGEFKVKVTAP
ncbi:MAG: hypothetical protein J0I06_21720 [Planctomycetes bacterium]|nr:hypothetical protein [Planctomycetota bacterium]